MKTAKEMFEELDYIKIKENDNYVLYKHKRTPVYIEFTSNLTKSIKHISCYFKYLMFKQSVFLTVEELKAIDKQIEELGWE